MNAKKGTRLAVLVLAFSVPSNHSRLRPIGSCLYVVGAALPANRPAGDVRHGIAWPQFLSQRTNWQDGVMEAAIAPGPNV